MIFEATKWLQCCCTSYSHRQFSTSQFILFRFHTRSLSLLNSHSARSAHSAHSAHLLHPPTPASQLTLFLTLFAFFRPSEQVSRNARGQDHASPFHENCTLKKTQRYIDDERYFVYGSADTLGLLAPILHSAILQ